MRQMIQQDSRPDGTNFIGLVVLIIFTLVVGIFYTYSHTHDDTGKAVWVEEN